MEKKDKVLPSLHKTSTSKQQNLSFKVRANLLSKDKQNKINKTITNAKAKNIVTKAKFFNSPQLIFALNQSVRCETNTNQLNDSQFGDVYFREVTTENKTFHFHQNTPNKSHENFLQCPNRNPRYYAFNKERDKAVQLANWVHDKLETIKNKNTFALDDILEYNQTVINYGLGQIIQSVRKRCKQQGETLKFIWDSTFTLFQNLLNILSNQIDKKDQQLIDNEKQLQKIYLTNLGYIKNKNESLQKHLDLLYGKMKRIILWNRRLRNDRFKQQINRRVLEYRLATYTSALQEAVQMLLRESKQPSCLKLAKKIISKLYKQRNQKSRKDRKKTKHLQNQAKQFVHENAKQFVVRWLKKNSLQQDQKIQNAVLLTQDQKLQVMKISDQNLVDEVDIYDFFKTVSTGAQTFSQTAEVCTQYEEDMSQRKTKTVGVQTKRVYKSNIGSQTQAQCSRKNIQYSRDKSRSTKKNLSATSAILKNNTNTKKSQHFNNQKQTLNSGTKIKMLQKKSISKKPMNEHDLELSELSLDNNQNLQGRIMKRTFCIDSQFSLPKTFMKKSQKQIIDRDDQFSQYTENRQTQKIFKNRITLGGIVDEWQIQDECMYEQGNMNQFQRMSSRMNNNKQILQDRNDKNVGNPRKKVKSTKQIYTTKQGRSSQRYITQPEQLQPIGYKVKPLLRKKFEQAYESDMKSYAQSHKEQIVRQVVRRRSFYKTNRMFNESDQKQLILLWYRPNRYFNSRPRKELNQIDENIYNFFSNIIKNTQLASNFPKSKAYYQTCIFFSTISNSLNNMPKSIPKNKQFINLSVTSITKFISRLIFDYLRKVRGDYEEISIDLEKVYYPLSVILVDHMINKYGLREIAEKKLRDFMEKVSNFVGISERINFFYRLFGAGDEMIGADELLIYMKCLVYFDIKRTIPIMNISKDFTVQRALTDKQTVLAQVDEIIKDFFCQSMRQQAKWRVQRYFLTYQLPPQFDIERIATLLIEELLSRKKQNCEHYLPIHKNCQGNFFPNLFKTVQIFSSNQIELCKYTKMIQQIFKNADILDQSSGKSISELRFLGLCVKLGFPHYSDIKNRMIQRKNGLMDTLCIGEQQSVENEQLISKIKKKYNMKICVQKQAPDYWLWSCAQITHDVPLINACTLLGNLRLFKSPSS